MELNFRIWEMLLNAPLISGLVSMLTTQTLKIFLPLFKGKKPDWSAFLHYGGMPSGHTAFIVSVTTAIGITTGWDSPIFALAAVISSIVIYDILKLRVAVEINLDSTRQLSEKKLITIEKKAPQFKGHKPTEVIAGLVWGMLMAFLTCRIYSLII